MSCRSSAAKYRFCSASTCASTAGSSTVEPHRFAIAFPADQVAGFIVLRDEARRFERLALIAFLVGDRAARARGVMRPAEHGATSKRHQGAMSGQSSRIACARREEFRRIVLMGKIGVVHFRLMRRTRKRVAD